MDSNDSGPTRPGRAQAGFTLVEIAIAIGVIGFALVAIIGILPTGLQVQRDNRTETILNQDATFWIEAIRNGARGQWDLAKYVDRIELTDKLAGTTRTMSGFGSGAEIIGLLTTQAAITNVEARAWVWAVSGSAAEKEQNAARKELSFKYRMTVHIERGTNFAVPFNTLAVGTVATPVDPLATLCHLQLRFEYPLGVDDKAPTSRKQVYGTLISREIETNVFGGNTYFFFTP